MKPVRIHMPFIGLFKGILNFSKNNPWSHHSLILLLMISGLFAGCRNRDQSHLNYSTLHAINHSILKEYAKASKIQGANIKYPLCVTAQFPITDKERNQYLKIEEQAVNRWNNALRGQPGWKVNHIEMYLVGGTAANSCPSIDNGLRVYKLLGLATGNRGYAIVEQYLNVISRAEFAKKDLKREMHEYGHQLGLGDTYTEASYQTPEGQPPGIMNLYYNVMDLTEDDIAGVRNVWRMIHTGSGDPCGEGYQKGKASKNRNKTRFCVKTTVADGPVTHEDQPEQIDRNPVTEDHCLTRIWRTPEEDALCEQLGGESSLTDNECDPGKTTAPNGECILERDHAHCSSGALDLTGNCRTWQFEKYILSSDPENAEEAECPGGTVEAPSGACISERAAEHCKSGARDLFGNCKKWKFPDYTTVESEADCAEEGMKKAPNGVCIAEKDWNHCMSGALDFSGNCRKWRFPDYIGRSSELDHCANLGELRAPSNECISSRDFDHCSSGAPDLSGDCHRWQFPGYSAASSSGESEGACAAGYQEAPSGKCILDRDFEHCSSGAPDLFGNCKRWEFPGYEDNPQAAGGVTANGCPAGKQKAPKGECILHRDFNHCSSRAPDLFGNCKRWGFSGYP